MQLLWVSSMTLRSMISRSVGGCLGRKVNSPCAPWPGGVPDIPPALVDVPLDPVGRQAADRYAGRERPVGGVEVDQVLLTTPGELGGEDRQEGEDTGQDGVEDSKVDQVGLSTDLHPLLVGELEDVLPLIV